MIQNLEKGNLFSSRCLSWIDLPLIIKMILLFLGTGTELKGWGEDALHVRGLDLIFQKIPEQLARNHL